MKIPLTLYTILQRYLYAPFQNQCALFLLNPVAPWCSGNHCRTISFNKAWAQIMRRFQTCTRSVGDSWWWESLKMAQAGNQAKCLSSVNHTEKNNSSLSLTLRTIRNPFNHITHFNNFWSYKTIQNSFDHTTHFHDFSCRRYIKNPFYHITFFRDFSSNRTIQNQFNHITHFHHFSSNRIIQNPYNHITHFYIFSSNWSIQNPFNHII